MHFYVRRTVYLLEPMEANPCIVYIYLYLEIFNFYLYIQLKIISKCITFMTSQRQRNTDIPDTENMVEM